MPKNGLAHSILEGVEHVRQSTLFLFCSAFFTYKTTSVCFHFTFPFSYRYIPDKYTSGLWQHTDWCCPHPFSFSFTLTMSNLLTFIQICMSYKMVLNEGLNQCINGKDITSSLPPTSEPVQLSQSSNGRWQY